MIDKTNENTMIPRIILLYRPNDDFDLKLTLLLKYKPRAAIAQKNCMPVRIIAKFLFFLIFSGIGLARKSLSMNYLK